MISKPTGVLLYPLFSEYELTVALSVLKQGEHPIVTIGVTAGPIRGESDLNCLPDTTIDEIDPASIGSLLLPGCMDISTLYHNEDLITFIRRCAAANEDLVIGAISSSPYLLAKARVLDGHRFTVGIGLEEREKTGVFQEHHYRSEQVVEDGRILTARGRAFVEFGIRFGRMLELEFDPEWYG